MNHNFANCETKQGLFYLDYDLDYTLDAQILDNLQ